MTVDALVMSYSIQLAEKIFDKTPVNDKPTNPLDRIEMICKMAARIYQLKKEGK
jgi:hypothetical protein